MDSITNGISNKTRPLARVQALLKDRGLAALLVRSTDRYFNEYVPKSMSVRAKITGFDGSVGDAIITKTGAHLFVDGRYSLQARAQAQGFTIHVCQNGQSIENSWLRKLLEILSAGDILGYDPSTIDLNLFDRLSHQVAQVKAKLDPQGERILKELMDGPAAKTSEKPTIFKVDDELSGLSSDQKLAKIASLLSAHGLDGFVAVKLDDIAWVSNLRSHFFPYQSSLPGLACVLHDRLIFGVAVGSDLVRAVAGPHIEVVEEHALFPMVRKKLAGSSPTLGIDAGETSKAHEIALRDLDIEVKRVENPISSLKALKNEKELLHMRSAFKKADLVVYQTQNFVIDCFEKGKTLSEGDVDDHIKDGFKKSGAEELSFRPICASGKNGAIIHYGSPDREQALKEGSLFLLDTGAYYEGGYATDLTRTFLGAKKSQAATPWQKEMFTLVLKASIRGLGARIKRGTLGLQLDAIVRAPLWQAGLDFAHGTGHGVGINVHEFPPRIGPTSTTPLLEGQVFSIEPGLYFEDLGGVRIENLATIVADPNNPSFLRVLPLTFCPMDERLIEHSMLDDYEERFLEYYRKEWDNPGAWPKLPPVPTTSFSGQPINDT